MRSLLCPIVAAVLFAAGCNRSPDALITRQIDILKQAADTLQTIKGEASATAAAPKLAKLERELNGLVPQVKALKLTPAERKDLEDKHRDEMEAGRADFAAELARVRNLKLNVGGLSELDKAVVH